jgi:hypothetical protein
MSTPVPSPCIHPACAPDFSASLLRFAADAPPSFEVRSDAAASAADDDTELWLRESGAHRASAYRAADDLWLRRSAAPSARATRWAAWADGIDDDDDDDDDDTDDGPSATTAAWADAFVAGRAGRGGAAAGSKGRAGGATGDAERGASSGARSRHRCERAGGRDPRIAQRSAPSTREHETAAACRMREAGRLKRLARWNLGYSSRGWQAEAMGVALARRRGD